MVLRPEQLELVQESRQARLLELHQALPVSREGVLQQLWTNLGVWMLVPEQAQLLLAAAVKLPLAQFLVLECSRTSVSSRTAL